MTILNNNMAYKRKGGSTRLHHIVENDFATTVKTK